MISQDELFYQNFPKNDEEYLRILSGYDRGFLKLFMGSLRAIYKGDFSGLRRLKKSGEPYYDIFTGEWRDFNGQRLDSERQIRLEIAKTRRDLIAITQKFINPNFLDNNGRPTIPPNKIPDWEKRVSKIIANGNVRAYGIGHGNARQADYQKIASHVNSEMGYLANFAKQMNDGELKKFSTLRRIGMYSDSILLGHSQGDIDGRDPNMWEGFRQLGISDHHCQQCPGYATDGYVNLSDIMGIGICSDCMSRCKCTIKFRKKKEMYYSDLVGVNADLLTRGKIAEINFQYYARMGLQNKTQARSYSMLKRKLGHTEALKHTKLKYNL